MSYIYGYMNNIYVYCLSTQVGAKPSIEMELLQGCKDEVDKCLVHMFPAMDSIGFVNDIFDLKYPKTFLEPEQYGVQCTTVITITVNGNVI